MQTPKATKPTLKILESFLDDPDEEQYGFGLIKKSGVKSGTLYPVLMRLEQLGWVESHWQEDDCSGPRRRLYRLTGDGAPAARRFLTEKRLPAPSRRPAPSPKPNPAEGRI